MNRLSPQEAAALLRRQDHILILTHRRPDGDTTGCAAGLCRALRQLSKTAWLLKNPDMTSINAVYVDGLWAPEDFSPAFVVSVDVAARSLFFPAAEPYIDRIGLAVDHHPSFEDFGEARCVDASRAACGEIVYEICRALGEITPEVALPLYAAVATDTGCFVYANTTANTHQVAAALLETGIDYFTVNKRHFRTKTRRRIAIEAELMGNAEFFHQDRGVFLTIPLSLLARTGADENDLDDISSLAGIIEGVDCGAVLRELKDGEWKLSLRTGANGRVNATRACGLLGGGGHAMAAGATLHGTLEEVKRQVLDAIDQVAEN
ncbi:MAG: phosphoesterase RecJ domain-containing protein [Oscillospiraceae bacterium]|nr:phosphoesterase RecJ domain-containing protein [Oscillospiraceae bacterium]